MGCFNSKNINDDSAKNSQSPKDLSKSKESASEKTNKNFIITKTNFNINVTDLVGEKSGNINQSYNLLLPALGKG